MNRETVDIGPILDDLDRDGYAIRECVLTPQEIAGLRAGIDPLLAETPTGRNAFEGFLTKRLYSPLAKTRVLDDLVLSLWLDELGDALIGPHTLSSIIAIEVGPGEVAQAIHRDDSIYPLPRPHDDVVFNTMWALDDFTIDNGATVLHPGSHRALGGDVPSGVEPVQAVMPAGSVLIWGGRTAHGGGANRTDRWRLGVVIEYVAGWLRPHENIQASIPTDCAAPVPAAPAGAHRLPPASAVSRLRRRPAPAQGAERRP